MAHTEAGWGGGRGEYLWAEVEAIGLEGPKASDQGALKGFSVNGGCMVGPYSSYSEVVKAVAWAVKVFAYWRVLGQADSSVMLLQAVP